jgi:DNA polymerase-4
MRLALSALCRDCLHPFSAEEGAARPLRCPSCSGWRTVAHGELRDLAIAHVDCDSFYASIEKRDRPELADKPILIGGTGPRSVVATACYIARRYGCRSAMPMYKARELCPQAVIVHPDHGKYRRVSAEIHRIFHAYTDLIEPIALDEAYLDLAHRPDIPEALADIALRVEQEVGISLSVGLSYNKFLAKIASDLEKPRRGAGFFSAASGARYSRGWSGHGKTPDRRWFCDHWRPATGESVGPENALWRVGAMAGADCPGRRPSRRHP